MTLPAKGHEIKTYHYHAPDITLRHDAPIGQAAQVRKQSHGSGRRRTSHSEGNEWHSFCKELERATIFENMVDEVLVLKANLNHV